MKRLLRTSARCAAAWFCPLARCTLARLLTLHFPPHLPLPQKHYVFHLSEPGELSPEQLVYYVAARETTLMRRVLQLVSSFDAADDLCAPAQRDAVDAAARLMRMLGCAATDGCLEGGMYSFGQQSAAWALVQAQVLAVAHAYSPIDIDVVHHSRDFNRSSTCSATSTVFIHSTKIVADLRTLLHLRVDCGSERFNEALPAGLPPERRAAAHAACKRVAAQLKAAQLKKTRDWLLPSPEMVHALLRGAGVSRILAPLLALRLTAAMVGAAIECDGCLYPYSRAITRQSLVLLGGSLAGVEAAMQSLQRLLHASDTSTSYQSTGWLCPEQEEESVDVAVQRCLSIIRNRVLVCAPCYAAPCGFVPLHT